MRVKCRRDGELSDGRMKFLLCKNFVELALPFAKRHSAFFRKNSNLAGQYLWSRNLQKHRDAGGFVKTSAVHVPHPAVA